MKSGGIACLLVCLCFLGAFTSCQKGEEEEDVVVPDNVRTVLVYVAADNSLGDGYYDNESGTRRNFVDEDYEELKAGMLQLSRGSGMRLLVYMDKSEGSSAPVLTELVRTKDGVEEKVVKEYEDRNSVGVSETLEVFDDVFNNSEYQAESYGLVYWSHCDGWIPYPVPTTRWIGQDEGNGDNRMNLSELVSVLEQAPHFDFILFDACFMQSVEVAYELRDYTDYYIASPTENPGPGAPYDKILPYMFVEGEAAQLADAYFNVYKDMYRAGSGLTNSNWTAGVSISVVKTAMLAQLASQTRQTLEAVANSMQPSALRNKVFNYDKRSRSSNIGYFDMVGLMNLLVEDASAYDTWKEAFDAAIAYWNTTGMNYSQFYGMFSMEGANGLTHYIPKSTTGSAAAAYRSTEWYKSAGLSQLGW